MRFGVLTATSSKILVIIGEINNIFVFYLLKSHSSFPHEKE